MKYLKAFILLTVVMFSFSIQNSIAQSPPRNILEAIEMIVNDCDKNRPEGGYMVCKGGDCVSGKCISVRSRCDDVCGDDTNGN